MTYLSFLQSLLADAGRTAMEFSGNQPVHIKDSDPNQVVTTADLAIGEQLQKRIREEYPDDAFIDEEFGVISGRSRTTWITDPIDGTSNFAAGSPLFGIMVGVLDAGIPVAGGVILPALPETYVAEAGRGAYCNGARLGVGSHGNLSSELIAYGIDIHPDEIDLDCRILAGLGSRSRGIRMSNCIFDCMMVAKGVYGAFMHRHNRLWDCVAAHVVIQESGGVFTAMDGSPLDYSDPLTRTADDFSILACGPGFHETITGIVREQST